jgi:hypothetical protein
VARNNYEVPPKAGISISPLLPLVLYNILLRTVFSYKVNILFSLKLRDEIHIQQKDSYDYGFVLDCYIL